MWFGTTLGLMRYDSHRSKIYKHVPNDSLSLPSDYVRDIVTDGGSNLWLTTVSGISYFDAKTEKFQNFSLKSISETPSENPGVFAVFRDSKNHIWMSTNRGVYEIRRTNGKVSFSRNILSGLRKEGYRARNLREDRNGVFWVATDEGLIRINKDGSQGKLYVVSNDKESRYKNELFCVHIDQKDRIWLGSSKNSLYLFDKATERFQEITSLGNAFHENALEVTALTQDKRGMLWVTTLNGLACMDPETHAVKTYRYRKNDPSALPDEGLMAIYCDNENGVWLGSYYTGVAYFNPDFIRMNSWPVPLNDPRSTDYGYSWIGTTLSNRELWIIPDSQKEILFRNEFTGAIQKKKLPLPSSVGYDSFQAEDENILWCAVSSLLSKVDLATGRREDFAFPMESGRPVTGRTRFITRDKTGKLWLGGDYGLFRFDEKTGVFHRISSVGGVFCYFTDARNTLWLAGSKDVLYTLQPETERIEKYPLVSDNPNLALRQVWGIAGDPSGRIWMTVGGNRALFYFDQRTHKLTSLLIDGLSDDNGLIDLHRDKKGYLWISSDDKIIRYHPDKKSLQIYSYRDGLPAGATLRAKGAALTPDGSLFTATTEGIIRFRADSILTKERPSLLLPATLRVFRKEVTPGDSSGILSSPVYDAKELVFHHDQNTFTLDFSLLSYGRSYENKYAYKLEGFEKNWTYTKTPSATYANMPAGDYVLLLRASNADGYWNPDTTRLSITILPPWWKSNLAYFVYFLLFSLSLYFIIRYFWRKSALQKEASLYQAKLDFFTNVSHEIRTHLSLIVGPIEKASQLQEAGQGASVYLTFARNNSERLMNLVNELLDFRKMESGKIILHVSPHNLVHSLTNTLGAFQHVAEEKDVNLHFTSGQETITCWYDLIQMQKVFFNLIGNAIKFTPEGGHVSVSVSETDAFVFVDFQDTGRGIAPEHLQHLFRNFYQVYDAEQNNTGYGIGLALARQIILQHGGDLSVKSNADPLSPDHGSCFTLRLPKGKMHFDPTFTVENPSPVVDNEPPILPENLTDEPASPDGHHKHTVLLIEDNEELRAFCREALREKYNILEAGTGKAGLEIAQERVPDLVVCDIMMPGIGGLEVCRRLKSELATSHIPVLLLTAKTSVPNIIKGLSVGADDYITKPFHIEVLSLKISNHIQTRENLRSRYLQTASGSMEPAADTGYTLEDRFLQDLKKIVEDNIGDQDFGVDQLAFRAGLSVSALYRKLRALTGITVNDYIKNVRMKKALEYLESGRYQVNEVATLVGFDDPKYFSREFRRINGKLPSDVLKKND